MTAGHYLLEGLNAIARIGFAIGVLLVLVQGFLWPAPRGTPLLERLFWSAAFGIVVLTGIGQVLCMLNIYSFPTLILSLLAVGLMLRWYRIGETPSSLTARARDLSAIALLNLLDRRVNVGRRISRLGRRARRRLEGAIGKPGAAWWLAGWVLLAGMAFVLRAYRPLSSLDLGLTDSYVHLYWLKLLEIGKQVDPSWGPYPRGLHFVLLAIRTLTNVDAVLLVNFFGAFVGTLMVLATADLARRISGSNLAGLAAGLLFGTFVGGPGQFFALGGRFLLETVRSEGLREISIFGREIVYLPESVQRGGYDLAFWVFQRQTATLPQEFAVCFLFPAGLFAHRYLEERRGWDLAGYALCAAAIATTHPGVGLPLAVIIVACVLAAAGTGRLTAEVLQRFLRVSLVAGAAGFSWTLAFIRYRTTGGWISFAPVLDRLFASKSGGKDVSSTLAEAQIITSTTTVMLILLGLVLVTALVCVAVRRLPLRGVRLMVSLSVLALLLIQLSEDAGIPALIHPDRNCVWLLMAGVAVAATVVVGPVAMAGRLLPAPWRAPLGAALLAAGLGAWGAHSEGLRPEVFDRELKDFTEHGSAPQALLAIAAGLEPNSWTAVTYGQEFPHVLGKGYHLDASDFLRQFDPNASQLLVPTRFVLIFVEKQPHSFEINAWAVEASRADLEARLQAWCVLYQRAHGDMKVAWEDDDVQVLMIARSEKQLDGITRILSKR